MSKRNVAYIKPDEPAFLKRIKQQIGYQEPEDTLEAKRGPIQNIGSDDDSDQYDEREDEKPIVVQLKDGDFTREEAEKIEKEEAEKPADLSQRIIFKKKKKKDESKDDSDENKKSSGKSGDKKSKKDKTKPSKSLLSFDDDEEGD